MKKFCFLKEVLSVSLISILLVLSSQKSNSQTYCISPGGADQITGEKDGYRYELWDYNAEGNACMTLGSGALFSGEWSGITNYLARRGLGYDQTQEHQEIGTFFAEYACDYNPNASSGNSYLAVYGWTIDSLKEFYIIEDWRNWIPSMAAGSALKGTINVNGSVYDIYEHLQVNQPSIVGNTTFEQYFSIRRDVRNSGKINISDHFNKWEELGMIMGKMHEVSFVVEGYQNSGDFEFTNLDVYLGGDLVPERKDNPENSQIRVFPNPCSGTMSVELADWALEGNMTIYDASGRMVYSVERINSCLFQLSDLKRGIYIIHVNSHDYNCNTRFIVY
jgi:endo-1,4-beta-xylanase